MWSPAVLMQTLGKIYSILTDKDKRAVYDEDGTVDEESSIFDQVYLHTYVQWQVFNGCIHWNCLCVG